MKKIFIFIAFVLFAVNAGAQDDIGSLISPGPLTEPHAKYEGIGNCTKCHSLGKGVPDSKCLECHDKLAERIKNKEGLHAAFTDACIKCHTDHKGKGFKIISLDKEKFDHDSTGYKLQDKHVVACNKCHKKEGVYTGLQRDCLSCHEDKHKGQLGKDCARCHNFKGWKDIEKFNHNRDSKYSLTGRHIEVKCERCHVRNIYKIEKFEECITCHKDPHKGKPACAECHTTESWKKVKVDHAKTNYPLTGKHIEVNCEKCHKNNQLKGIPYLTCTSSFCHTDTHKNQFPGKPCESCHTTKGWKPSLFNHNAPEYVGFRLDGKHIETACDKCHKEGKYKPINYKTCDTSDCHKDTHKGQFRGKACESCHTTKGWKLPLFNHNAPEYVGFRLDGKHLETACDKCHKEGKYKPINYKTCDTSDCHKDTHKGQFRGKACESCHTTKGWKLPLFNHNAPEYVGFKLEGKHLETACDKCHKEGRYKPINYKTCDTSDCHKDTHKGQFKGKACESCHNVKGWKPSLFNHNAPEYVGFRLDGKHLTTACDKCHKEGRYKPINYKTCDTSDCHKDTHKGQFKGKACESCHNVKGWKPSLFNHNAPEYVGFRLDGKHLTTACDKCHKDGKYKPIPSNCLNCHEKDDIHKKELGINCEKCHNAENWKKAIFNHNLQSKFPLIGKHTEIKCEKCHQDRKYKTGKERCGDCHTDIHKGEFKEECSNCHTQVDWMPRKFDHKGRTGFDLKGVHNDVLCISCHKTKGEYKKVNRYCNQCHVDPHFNQFGMDCSKCHTENSWNPTQFNHSATGYPLVGKHRNEECQSCHRNRVYRNTPAACVGCHLSKYNSAPNHVAKGYTQDCAYCHISSFTTWAFNHSKIGAADCSSCHLSTRPSTHTSNATKYPSACDNCHTLTSSWLTRRHISASSGCSTCHTSDRPSTHTSNATKYPSVCEDCHTSTSSWTTRRHYPTSSGCYNCHVSQRPASHTTGGYSNTCELCHTSTSSWAWSHSGASSGCSNCHLSKAPASHTTNNYGTTCENCHRYPTWTFNHSSAGTNCYTCHSSKYPSAHSSYSSRFGTSCGNCHTYPSWSTTTFSHSFTAFPTNHERTTSCSQCHSGQNYGNKGGCRDCHGDEHKKGYSNAQCLSCHPTGRGKPVIRFK